MSRSISLLALRDQVREYCDCVRDPHITDSFLNSLINRGIPEFIDVITTVFGTDYYVTSETFVTTGVASYDLPDDFYKLVGVDVQTSGSDFQEVGRFNFHNRNQGSSEMMFYPWATDTEYRVVGDSLLFAPIPPTDKTMKTWYIPTSVILDEDESEFDFINGWEEYVLLWCSIRVKMKKEEPINSFRDLLREKREVIVLAAENRDSANEEMIQDVNRVRIR